MEAISRFIWKQMSLEKRGDDFIFSILRHLWDVSEQITIIASFQGSLLLKCALSLEGQNHPEAWKTHGNCLPTENQQVKPRTIMKIFIMLELFSLICGWLLWRCKMWGFNQRVWRHSYSRYWKQLEVMWSEVKYWCASNTIAHCRSSKDFGITIKR